MPWLHGMKTRHEQEKEPNYLKNEPFSKSSWNACRELPKKCEKNNFQSSLLEVFLKKHCVEVSFQISLPTATLFVFPVQLFSILWIIRTTSSEYRSIMPRAFQTKCEKNDLSPQFNDPSVNETEYDISIHQISCKNKAKPNQCSSNHKVN